MMYHRLCLSAVLAGALSTGAVWQLAANERGNSTPVRRPLSMVDALQQRGDEQVGGRLPLPDDRSPSTPRVASRLRPLPKGTMPANSGRPPLQGPNVTTPKPPATTGLPPAVKLPVAPTTPPVSTPVPGTVPQPVGTSDLEVLEARVRRTLDLYYHRKLNTREHNCWEVMHALIAYGVDTEILRVTPRVEPVNAAAWLCANGQCGNYQLLYLDRGRVKAKWGVGLQGHYGQFLAILAQSHVPLDYTIRVDNRDFTVADLLESEKLGCRTGMELTFKLLSIAHYSNDLDEVWRNELGQEWSVSKLIGEEIVAPILRGAACGGTHRLTGLAHAVRKRERLGQPMDGQFKRAKKYLDDYHQYTLALQNPDGSFSTEWFRGAENRSDIDRKLQTTGHILEWLVFSLPDEELTQPKVLKAVHYLSSIMLAEPNRNWEIGPVGHALHALALYDARVFAPLARETAPALTGTAEETPPVESSAVEAGSPAAGATTEKGPAFVAEKPTIDRSPAPTEKDKPAEAKPAVVESPTENDDKPAAEASAGPVGPSLNPPAPKDPSPTEEPSASELD